MPDSNNTPLGLGGSFTIFHFVAIILSLMLSLGAWQFSILQFEKRVGLHFEVERDRVVALISDRMLKYEDALWAGVAAIDSHGGDISYQKWRVFTQNLNLNERYPGVNGIGVIHFLNPQTLEAYLAKERRVRPGFRIYPKHDLPIYMPITFIEPEDINAAAIGLDVAHESNRRAAALVSRDTGTAQISGPITLVQDAEKTPGFLFYAPFYKNGPLASIADRQQAALGAVYAPFVVHKLMEGLLAKELRGVRFSIRDGDRLIFDELGTQDSTIDPDPMFSEQFSLDLYGRTWTLDMHSNLDFRQDNTSAQPTVILLVGLFIECLIISLLLLMARANKLAVSYADKVTVTLRTRKAELVEANAQLSQRNEELERFTYVASHDLRTPIRGINGLTEMLQEDLEDYLAGPLANPDVSTNLERIKDRVARMYDLTNGIKKVSCIKADKQGGDPLHLWETLLELAFDLGVKTDQLSFSGDVRTINMDPVNFRSVIENLIGNAIKHHGSSKDVQIDVSAMSAGERIRISVKDNGPGIAPQFQNRIFDVFETLRTNAAPESTGIGLAIVKKVVEHHGGKVTLESAVGAGSTFHFTWPAELKESDLKPVSKAA